MCTTTTFVQNHKSTYKSINNKLINGKVDVAVLTTRHIEILKVKIIYFSLNFLGMILKAWAKPNVYVINEGNFKHVYSLDYVPRQLPIHPRSRATKLKDAKFPAF